MRFWTKGGEFDLLDFLTQSAKCTVWKFWQKCWELEFKTQRKLNFDIYEVRMKFYWISLLNRPGNRLRLVFEKTYLQILKALDILGSDWDHIFSNVSKFLFYIRAMKGILDHFWTNMSNGSYLWETGNKHRQFRLILKSHKILNFLQAIKIKVSRKKIWADYK